MRSPKCEVRRKSEVRSPKCEVIPSFIISHQGVVLRTRTSHFELRTRTSDFALRTSHFGLPLDFALRTSFTVFAQAQVSKPLPGINAVVVPIAKHEFNAVTSYVFGAQHGQVVGNRSGIKYAKPGYFADTVGAQALGSEVFDRI